MRLRGVYTALITPFKNGKIDDNAYADLINWQIEQGVSGVIPCGTTGEAATLSYEEHEHVIELCIEVVNKRVTVIAGTGSNCTDEAIRLGLAAKKAGADYLLSVTPYYNKPSQEGLYRHFKRLAEVVDAPHILYNVPGRTGIDLAVDTVARLAQIPNIVGIKDAHIDLSRPVKMRQVVPDTFSLLSGEDATAAAFLAQGGDGVISVTSNIAPKMLSDMHKAWWSGDMETFGKIRDRLIDVHTAMFCESNPCPVKYAVSLLGKCENSVRLPLWDISAASKEKVETAMRKAGII